MSPDIEDEVVETTRADRPDRARPRGLPRDPSRPTGRCSPTSVRPM